MSYYRIQLENFLRTLDITADTVLDVGGGQNPIKSRTKTWKVNNYQILDLPQFNLDEPFSYPTKADIVFCLEVFEYLIVPTVAMKNICNLLKPQGVAYVSFPLIYPVHQEIERDSLRYTLTGVRRMADYAGLKILDTTYRRTKTGTLIQYYAEDGMKQAKKYDHNVTGYIVKFEKS
jgi:2-polyprenyl-3-methyl-5-hydroxy-6-metoxy-1,4-benzoquinol methylase